MAVANKCLFMGVKGLTSQVCKQLKISLMCPPGMPTAFQPHTCGTDEDMKEHTYVQSHKLFYIIDGKI